MLVRDKDSTFLSNWWRMAFSWNLLNFLQCSLFPIIYLLCLRRSTHVWKVKSSWIMSFSFQIRFPSCIDGSPIFLTDSFLYLMSFLIFCSFYRLLLLWDHYSRSHYYSKDDGKELLVILNPATFLKGIQVIFILLINLTDTSVTSKIL